MSPVSRDPLFLLRRRFALVATAHAGAIGLVGCGGADSAVAVLPGGGGTGTIPAAPTPSPTPTPVPTPAPTTAPPTPMAGSTIGPVVSVEPLVINGVRYTVGPAGVTFADPEEAALGLQPGMIAIALGSMGAGGLTGGTSSLNVNAELRGMVSNLTAGANAFSVNNVEVLVGAGTLMVGFGGAFPAANDLVLVFGHPAYAGVFPTGQSRVLATRVQKLAAPSAPFMSKLSGFVSYDACPTCLPSGGVIKINNLPIGVDRSVVRGLAFPIPPGTLVRVRNHQGIAAPQWTASEVTAYAPTLLADSEAHVQGMSASVGNMGLTVGGISFGLSAITLITGGPQAELASGRLIEVKGRYRDGLIQASSLRFL